MSATTKALLARIISDRSTLTAAEFRELLVEGRNSLSQIDRVAAASALAEEFHDPEMRALGYELLSDSEIIEALCRGFANQTVELAVRTRLCSELVELCSAEKPHIWSIVQLAQILAKYNDSCIEEAFKQHVLRCLRAQEVGVRTQAAARFVKLVRSDELKRALNLMLPVSDRVPVAPLLFVVPEPVPAPAAPKASPSAPVDKEDDEDEDREATPARPDGKSSSKPPVKTLGKGRAARNPLSEAKVAEIIAALQGADNDLLRVKCLRALESSLANPAAFAEVERAAVGNNFATAEVACAILMRTEVELARRDALNVLYEIAKSDRLMRERAIAYFVNKGLPLDGKAR